MPKSKQTPAQKPTTRAQQAKSAPKPTDEGVSPQEIVAARSWRCVADNGASVRFAAMVDERPTLALRIDYPTPEAREEAERIYQEHGLPPMRVGKPWPVLDAWHLPPDAVVSVGPAKAMDIDSEQ